jgi:hypothetical protein
MKSAGAMFGMSHAVYLTMSKSTLLLVGLGLIGLSWILMRIRGSVKDPAPLGYEDEAGFHFGAPLKKK